MDKEVGWKQEYESLCRFISENPGIVIRMSEISIPQELRSEFYSRFDKIRAALVDAHYADLPVDVDSLCRHFLEAEREVIALLGIQKISMPVDLYSFLHTPREGLTRSIYARLFDLLQGKTTVDFFEQQCLEDLKSSSTELFRLGYEWWTGLVLIKLLEPEKAFLVDLDEEYNPFLTELTDISFGRQAHHPTIRIPEFVVYSRKLGRYVAIKMAVAKELEGYGVGLKPPVRPKKRTGDTSSALDSRVMLLSFMSEPDKIPIITDIYERTLTSPDWMLECITGSDLTDPEALEQVRFRLNTLNPTLGSCLVVIDDIPDDALPQVAEKIRPVSVGFDQAKLQAVLSTLI